MTDGFSPGLAGVVADKSAVGFINGQQGILQYRGYAVEDLAAHSTFEETAYLLIEGALPTAAQLAAFSDELVGLRAVPEGVLQLLRALPKDTHPMVAIQAATAALGGFYPLNDVSDPVANHKAALRLTANLATITAAFDRIRKDLPVVAPDPKLSHAANFLYMVNGVAPSEDVARLFDVCLILHAEHGFNASTFTARVVGSALANPYACVAGAIGTLSGPLHGGANEAVLKQLNEISGPEAAAGWLDEAIAAKKKVMGLGHRVYKVKDPRSHVLQTMAADMFKAHGSTPLYDIAEALEAYAATRLGPKGIYPNVDFFSGLVYQKLGIEIDQFTPVFAVSRVSGWVAHWLEQLVDNKIYRPSQQYVGAKDVPYVAIADRG